MRQAGGRAGASLGAAGGVRGQRPGQVCGRKTASPSGRCAESAQPQRQVFVSLGSQLAHSPQRSRSRSGQERRGEAGKGVQRAGLRARRTEGQGHGGTRSGGRGPVQGMIGIPRGDGRVPGSLLLPTGSRSAGKGTCPEGTNFGAPRGKHRRASVPPGWGRASEQRAEGVAVKGRTDGWK